MKKVLLASTALIMSAGIAAADVAVSGNGRMGIQDLGGAAGLEFNSRLRIVFTASGETDGGLTFGGSIRADNAAATTVTSTFVDDVNGVAPGAAGYIPTIGNANSGGGVNGLAGSVFVSGAFGTLTMGDVSGAAEAAVGDLDMKSLAGLGDHNEAAYLSNGDRPAMRYDYSIGAVTLRLSADNPKDTLTSEAVSVAATYATDLFSVSLGYEDTATNDHTILGATTTFSGVTVKALYGKLGTVAAGADDDQYGLSGTYSMGAIGVSAYGMKAFDGETDYGIGASYDLGGGAALVGGVARDNQPGGTDVTKFDFGMSMTF